MITVLDLNIYQAVYQKKSIIEKYLGAIAYDWVYSIVHYKAECTIGIPFDLFDKTIVGILLVDESLSIEQIGEIMGMNLIDNPTNQQYKDYAEYDILRMALDSLKDFGMIETGDIHYSSCRLTNIGKEYAKNSRKFKIEIDTPFTLFYDHVSENHIDAKDNIKNLKGVDTPLTKDYDFVNEELMKQIAEKQIPDIYNIENGNSFINPIIEIPKSKTVTLRLYLALIYNVENEEIRILAYEPNTKKIHDYFSTWLNENKKDEIVEQYIRNIQQPASFEILPDSYIQTLIQKNRLFQDSISVNPEVAFTVAKDANLNNAFIDPGFFWNNLTSFFSENTLEAWFFLPEDSISMLNILSNIISIDKPLFLLFNIPKQDNKLNNLHKLDKLSLQINNHLYVVNPDHITEFLVMFVEDSKVKILSNIQLGIRLKEVILPLNFIESINYEDFPESYFEIKKSVATVYLDIIANEINKLKLDETKLSKKYIQGFESIDQKAKTFSNLNEDGEISKKLTEIEASKNIFISDLKSTHQKNLFSNLQSLMENFKAQNFSNLDSLKPFSVELNNIENEFFEEYNELIFQANSMKTSLIQEEKRIREELLTKTFIIDTNVFIEYPEIISKIDSKHHIVISNTVIDELDRLKKKEKLKDKASKAISILNKQLGKNKHLRTAKANTNILGENYPNSPDNRILSVAYMYKEKNPVLLTSDAGLQLKAKSLEIPTISLNDFLGNKEIPISNDQSIGINYRLIFKKMNPDKDGFFQISNFIEIIKKQYPEFDYKILGFSKAFEFVESLGFFEVIEKKIIKLKSE